MVAFCCTRIVFVFFGSWFCCSIFMNDVEEESRSQYENGIWFLIGFDIDFDVGLGHVE